METDKKEGFLSTTKHQNYSRHATSSKEKRSGSEK